MSKQQVLNPRGLTETEVDVLDELCRLGQQEMVAVRLSVSHYTVRDHLKEARRKMAIPKGSGAGPTILAAVKFDRWRQGEGKGVPA